MKNINPQKTLAGLLATLAMIFFVGQAVCLAAIYPHNEWTRRIKPDIVHDKIFLLDDYIALTSTRHSLHLIHSETGDVYWEYGFYSPLDIFPIGSEKLLVISDNILHMLDVSERHKDWSFRMKKPEYEQLLMSEDGTSIAVRYGEKSHEVFSISGTTFPVGKASLEKKYVTLKGARKIRFNPELAGKGTRLEISGPDVRLWAVGADAPSWAFEADGLLSPTAALYKDTSLIVVTHDGAMHILKTENGDELAKVDLKGMIDMRFWDEKPENIDNYSNCMVFSRNEAVFVVAPSSISRIIFMRFPKSISLSDEKNESTMEWTLQRAIDEWGKKNYRDAVMRMKETADIWPDSPEAHLFLGMALSTLGELEAAVAELERAHKLDPYNQDVIANLSGNYMLLVMSVNPSQDPDKIVDMYNRVMDLQPDNRMPYIGLAEFYMGRSEHEKAIEVLRESFNHGFFGPEIHALILSANYMNKNRDKSLDWANHMIQLFPGIDIPYLLKGKILCKQGKYSQAVEVFSATPPRPTPGDDQISSIFPRLMAAGSAYFYGNALALSGNYQEGIKVLQEYARTFPETDEYESLKEEYKRKGAEASEQVEELWDKYGIGSFLELEAQKDFRLPAQLSVAHFQLLSGQKKKCLETIDEIESENPKDPEVLSYLGYIYSLAGEQLERAKEYVSGPVEAKPEDPIYLRNMAVYLFKAGQYAEAEKTFLKALEINPSTELLNYEYGRMLAEEDRTQEAIGRFRKELDMTPELKIAADALKKAEQQAAE